MHIHHDEPLLSWKHSYDVYYGYRKKYSQLYYIGVVLSIHQRIKISFSLTSNFEKNDKYEISFDLWMWKIGLPPNLI